MKKLSKLIVLNILILLAVGGFAGCSSTEGNTTVKNAKVENKNTAVVVENNKTPESVPPANVSTNAGENKTVDTAATGDKIGVPECDEYIAKYEACVNKNVPENMRATMKSTFDQARKGWKTAAATPQGKASLGSACKQATEAAKASMAAYKCDF